MPGVRPAAPRAGLLAAALVFGCGGGGLGLSGGISSRVAVSSPNGGESWGITTSQEIAWTSEIVRDVRIELSRDGGGSWVEIVASVPASAGSYTWAVTGPESDECLARVSDASDGRPSDVSDAAFSITLYELEVVAPNGGEAWYYQGDDREIAWNASGVSGNVEVLYTADGSTWNAVATVLATDGSYTWTVPDEDSSTCLVRVQEEGGAGLSDDSDGYFTIAPAGITVIGPNGGEEWAVGSSQDITWTSAGVADVRIELSRDDGGNWEDIVASTDAGAGSCSWAVTGPESSLCLVRVSHASDGLPADESDAAFAIAIVPGVTIAESDGSTDVREGGATDSYTVVLQTQPTDDVVIAIWPDAQANLGAGAGAPINLTFIASEWNVPQTVTVWAVDDVLCEGVHSSTITHTAASGDGDYAGVAIRDVVVSVADNDLIYVDGGATGASDGSSWEDAYREVADALAAAASGQEIWVAAGSYRPGPQRTDTFQLVSGVAVYGGFNGTETQRSQRDWETNLTTLSGDVDGDDQPNWINRGDNSYHVVIGATGAILDGFTIRSGYAHGAPDYNYGGGMVNDGVSPTVRNCSFVDNSAEIAGGMFNWYNCQAEVTNCAFIGNQAAGGAYNHGGGVHNSHDVNPTFTGCTFIANTADQGGGMRQFRAAFVTLVDCTFVNNSATEMGGGLHVNRDVASVRNCIFMGNAAPTGAGVCVSDFEGATTFAAENCVFSGNTATDKGGAMGLDYWSFGQTVDATNCTFEANSAQSQGGGLYTPGGPTVTFKNCILWGNTAPAGPQISGGDPTVSYSDVQGGWSGAGSDNIDSDPLFVAPADVDGTDNVHRTADDGLRLQAGSPCIDTGTSSGAPVTDITGTGRPQGSGYDIGAYEQ